MSLKQLAERLGVAIKELDFELDERCKNCKKLGGTYPECGNSKCTIVAFFRVKE